MCKEIPKNDEKSKYMPQNLKILNNVLKILKLATYMQFRKIP